MSENMGRAVKKGIVFTLESLISFALFLIVISSLFILVNQTSTVPLKETVLLNDIYQVLELKYHTELSLFAMTGTVAPNLGQYLELLREYIGHVFFIKFGTNVYPSDAEQCTPLIMQKRLLVYADTSVSIDHNINYFHELYIGICK